jgi:hypothetical protein
MAALRNEPNPALTGTDADREPYQFDALDEWILQNARVDDPVELRRNDLHGWAEAAGFSDIDVRNLGQPDFWEMRFSRGTNTECTTAAEAERWFGYIARGCQCRSSRASL